MTPAQTPVGGRAWEDQVIELARLYGWRVAHFRAARTAKGWRTPVGADGAGFFDLVLVRGPDLLFVELKADTARLTDEQRAWFDAIAPVVEAVAKMLPDYDRVESGAHVEAHVWRPRDFNEGVHDRLRVAA